MNEVKPTIEQNATFRLSILSTNISNGMARYLGTVHALTLTSWRTLVILQLEGPLTATAICERGGIDKAHMSRNRPVLERRGLIRRVPGRTSKRHLLSITPAGTELYNTINPIAREREARLLSVLEAEERIQFNRILDKLYAASVDFR